MGNIGRSSSGCALCRKRKIKCDEGKPGCKRCAQIRKTCPGYPFQVQLELRTEPGSTSTARPDRLVSVPPGPVSPFAKVVGPSPPPPLLSRGANTDANRVKSEDGTGTPRLQKLAPAHRSISPPPKYDIKHQSLCFFLNLFCFQAGRLYQFPILDFLPSMLSDPDPTSCISHAAMAVSRMALADRYSGKDVRLETGKEYGHALSLTNATIRDNSASVQDETVVAVWLLGLYEQISVVLTHGRTTSEPKTLEEEWQSHLSHVRGAMNLLRVRGLEQFTTARGEKVFRVLKAAIQMRLFILSSVISKDFDGLEVDLYNEEQEFVPSKTANKATSYFHRVARLLEKIKLFLAQSSKKTKLGAADSTFMSDADILLQYGESLDSSMEGWCKNEPGWDMMRVTASTNGTMWALYPSHARSYFYSFWVFLYHLRYLSARFKLYEGLIELVKFTTTMPSSDGRKKSMASESLRIAKFRTISQMTAGDLVGLTAYALGDVTPTGSFDSSASARNPRKGFQEINVIAAMQLVLPLKMLQRSDLPTAIQKGAVDLAISHIGDGLRRQPGAI